MIYLDINLGELKKVPVRREWRNESNDFTPWLAEEKNLEKLSKAIGLELELVSTEVSAGPYSADILAKDVLNDEYVVIENQLDKTDHDHLGKSVVYASALDASSIVWIATQFTDEHRKALDWLNDNTSDELLFFGVLLELWQIDSSRPAVKFNVVSKPAKLAKQIRGSRSSGELTDMQKDKLAFWQSFANKLELNKIPSVQTPRPSYWFDVSLGKSHIHLSNTVSFTKNEIKVRVYIGNKIAPIILPQLLDRKEEIESLIGHNLIWDPNEDARDKVITLKKNVNLSDKKKWDEYINWFVEKTVKFRVVFSEIIKELDFDRSIDEEN